MNSADAQQLLGLSAGFTEVDLSKAYRRAAAASHPDKGGDPAAFREATEARDVLLAHLARSHRTPPHGFSTERPDPQWTDGNTWTEAQRATYQATADAAAKRAAERATRHRAQRARQGEDPLADAFRQFADGLGGMTDGMKDANRNLRRVTAKVRMKGDGGLVITNRDGVELELRLTDDILQQVDNHLTKE